jgi:hypothetical protein
MRRYLIVIFQMDSVKKFMEEAHQRFALRKDHNDLKAKTLASNDDRALGDLTKIINSQTSDFNSRLHGLKEEIRIEMKQIQ